MNSGKAKHISPRDKKKEIFIKAYDEHFDKIYRFIYFKVGNTEEAQDLTSATFLKAWNYCQSNKIKRRTLKPLVYKIARNTVIDFYRSKSSSKAGEAIEGLDGAANIADERQDVARRMEVASDMSLVERGLMKLKDEYREIIVLRFTEELSIGEISKILDKPKGNVRVLAHRALKALKEVLNEKEK